MDSSTLHLAPRAVRIAIARALVDKVTGEAGRRPAGERMSAEGGNGARGGLGKAGVDGIGAGADLLVAAVASHAICPPPGAIASPPASAIIGLPHADERIETLTEDTMNAALSDAVKHLLDQVFELRTQQMLLAGVVTAMLANPENVRVIDGQYRKNLEALLQSAEEQLSQIPDPRATESLCKLIRVALEPSGS